MKRSLWRGSSAASDVNRRRCEVRLPEESLVMPWHGIVLKKGRVLEASWTMKRVCDASRSVREDACGAGG